jgi:hypothetical protein
MLQLVVLIVTTTWMLQLVVLIVTTTSKITE